RPGSYCSCTGSHACPALAHVSNRYILIYQIRTKISLWWDNREETRMKTIGALALALSATVAMSTPGWAAEYPERPIRLLIGYSPAGAGDLVGRIVGEAMSKHLGQSIVVENRPGAGSTLASSALAN